MDREGLDACGLVELRITYFALSNESVLPLSSPRFQASGSATKT